MYVGRHCIFLVFFPEKHRKPFLCVSDVESELPLTGSGQPCVRHDYTIGTLDVLKACDSCADMGQL